MSFAFPRHKISKEHLKSLNHEIVAVMQGEELSVSYTVFQLMKPLLLPIFAKSVQCVSVLSQFEPDIKRFLVLEKQIEKLLSF